MMKKTIFTLIFLAGTAAYAAAETDYVMTTGEKKSTVNFGVKGGFNSSMLFADEFTIGGKEISDIQNNYKVGYFATFFLRFNFKHHFFQPELSYTINKASVYINSEPYNAELLPENALIKTHMTSFDLPLLYGYKFIDKEPYGMAFYIGPQIAWTWKKHTDVEYSGFYQQYITEKLKPINYSAVFGIAINIAKIFCDFRYEIGANRMSDYIKFDKDATPPSHNQDELVFKRRRNVFSFSVGVIF